MASVGGPEPLGDFMGDSGRPGGNGHVSQAATPGKPQPSHPGAIVLWDNVSAEPPTRKKNRIDTIS